MAAIFQEVTVTWRGEEYTVTPTYRMIQRIEQRHSLAGLSARIARGEPPISHIAEVVSILLTSAGAKDASPEEVFETIMTEMDEASFTQICSAVVAGFVPQRRDAGNAPAPKPGAKKTRTKTKR